MELEHTVVWKEIHGQRVPVKVFPPESSEPPTMWTDKKFFFGDLTWADLRGVKVG